MNAMTRSLIGTIHPDDYLDIQEGVHAVQKATDILHSKGVRIEVPHWHRFWEYGTPLQMMLNHYQERMPEVTVLDVGSGWGAFGPTLVLMYNTHVTECEPGEQEFRDRQFCDAVLKGEGKRGLHVLPCHSDQLPDNQYDVVTCISVLEHMPEEIEARAWKNMVDRIKPGGLFFADVDCVPQTGKPHMYDNLRRQNFTLEMLKDRVDRLLTMGMIPLGRPDYTYHGDAVFDFTFFRIGMIKG